MRTHEPKENTAVIVICPVCKAPSKVPKDVEKHIEMIDGFDCWDCGRKVFVSNHFKYFVMATREE